MTRIIFEIILFQVLGFNAQDLTVCSSRTVEFPTNATGDVRCMQTQGGNVEIRLENPCGEDSLISQCRPLFVAVRPTTSVFETAMCARGM